MCFNCFQRRIFPWVLDTACGQPLFTRMRQKVVPQARGHVLEVGIGTGLNMPHYDAQKVSRITGLDPALALQPKARKRIAAAGIPVDLIGLSAETIPLPSGQMDSAVVTYALCTIPDAVAALKEVHRVLKPGASLLFCEHGLSPDAGVARWQNRIQPLWGPLAGGCHLNRDIPALLQAAGFRLVELEQAYVSGPKPWTFHSWGEAQAAE
ncbi:phospholipid methyltransferase [Hydrogenophaga crassostreae]|uniref:Phospholipid methyltransferase n=1 Tax=Hydrogenophaga crassostreae TaxID=1763535 RepID=A0A162P334_9BURK|nr:class I SAM-dependent methyltransferase [Hydrogenophaga crassostreae]AOW15447.1 phospholipid methyltransferase [Hydrogenophaga crassostreae]OAD40650.1 phospholipid methyltransferase [Hydrogenophaga crassostreae]